MDKVTDFLERYVQWLAVALGALFLAYAAYTYLPGVTTPVAVALQGKSEPLSPGEVDRTIDTEVADPLQARIDATPSIQTIVVPPYAKDIRDSLTKPTTNPALPALLINSRAIELPAINWDASSSDIPNSTKVQKLPTLPAAALDGTPTTGFAEVNVSGIAGGTTPTPTAAAAPAVGVGTGTASANTTSSGMEDRTWVRVPFIVSTQDLLRAFRGVNLPGDWNKTEFLRVELIRERSLGEDKWGPEEVVATLPTVSLQPMPSEGVGNQPQQQNYNVWAAQNQQAIVQPPFFPVVAGDDPNMTRPEVADDNTPRAFDVADYADPRKSLADLTPEQKRQVQEYRQKLAKEKQQQQPRPQPRPPANGGNRGGGGVVVPMESFDGTNTTYQNRPAPAPPRGGGRPANPTGLPPAEGTMTGNNPDVGGGMPMQPVAGQPIVLTQIPAAPFAPTPDMPDLQGVAYDITATPDATYRYRIRYAALNPIFGSQNVAGDAALAQVFALTAENKDVWTAPITIAPLTHIFIAQPLGGSIVKFTVFRWQAGKQQMTTVNAQSGDSIGKVENGVDFRTQWTLVEFRRDTSSAQAYAVLMNADGTLRRQTFETDSASPMQAKLKTEVEGAATTPGVAPGTGGAGTPPPARPQRPAGGPAGAGSPGGFAP